MMEIARKPGGWTSVDIAQKQFLSAVLLSALISADSAMAEGMSVAPAGSTAEDLGHAAYEHDRSPERSAWRSRTRFTPIETLISDNLQELRENAEVVFVGVLTESTLDNDRQGGVPITRYDFVVESYLKGESADHGAITLRNFGGRNQSTGETVTTRFSFDFAVGERYLVFLRPDFAKSTLPVISAMSVHEGGHVLANEHGQQLMRLDDKGAMSFSAEASFSSLNYGFVRENAATSAPDRTDAPAPVPHSGDVEVIVQDKLPSTASRLSNGLSAGVPLDSVVDQILD